MLNVGPLSLCNFQCVGVYKFLFCMNCLREFSGVLGVQFGKGDRVKALVVDHLKLNSIEKF